MNCSVSKGNDQNVAISLNNNAISSIIRGGTNTVSLVPSRVCDVVDIYQYFESFYIF
jgi:hypothetical protein